MAGRKARRGSGRATIPNVTARIVEPPAGTRDPLVQPFASDSIWNMPIGSGAVYVSAGLAANPGPDQWTPMPQIDPDIIILSPASPATAVKYNAAGWGGGDRCSTASGTTLATVPIPTSFVVGNSRANNSAAILAADGHTLIHPQPFTRCTSGSQATSIVKYPDTDIYGDGLDGSHGGSRMSALGGSIRMGELRPGQQGPKHALKCNVWSTRELFKATINADTFRWPALTSDSGAVGDYGTDGNNSNTAMKMGALLAIPASTSIASLNLLSEPGQQIAWTLQNYGMYIVDSTGGAAFAIEAEWGPAGDKRAEFESDYGYPMEQRVNDFTAWSNDWGKIRPALAVVNNNTASTIGGGGTPLQPLAAELVAPGGGGSTTATYQGSSTAPNYVSGAAATSLTLDRTTGTVGAVSSGDLLLAVVHIELTSISGTITLPSGWTQLTVSETPGITVLTAWKRATGSEPTTYTFSWTGGGYTTGVLHRFNGVLGTGTPVVATGAASTSTSLGSVGYTASAAGTGVWIYNGVNDSQTITPPTGYTAASSVTQGSGKLATRRDTSGAKTTGSGSASVGGAQVVVGGVILDA